VKKVTKEEKAKKLGAMSKEELIKMLLEGEEEEEKTRKEVSIFFGENNLLEKNERLEETKTDMINDKVGKVIDVGLTALNVISSFLPETIGNILEFANTLYEMSASFDDAKEQTGMVIARLNTIGNDLSKKTEKELSEKEKKRLHYSR